MSSPSPTTTTTTTDTTSSNLPATIQVYRSKARGGGNDNNNNNSTKSPECLLLHQTTNTTTILSYEILEDRIDIVLDEVVDFPVEYPQPDDALLLQCRLPQPKTNKKTPASSLLQAAVESKEEAIEPLSITGLSEEWEALSSKSKSSTSIRLTEYTYQSTTTNNHIKIATPDNGDCRQVLLSPWTRQPLSDTSTISTTDNNDPSMVWIDLRAYRCSGKDPLIPSLTSAAHFLRSLLGTSHAASPWYGNSRNTATNNNESPFEQQQRVAVLLDGNHNQNNNNNNDYQFLLDIRVGDICPSWMLYSISSLQVAPEWSIRDGETTNNDNMNQPATLLVYKPLPPRPLLTLSRPPAKVLIEEGSSSTALPKGCLWETYFEYQEEKENAKNNTKDTSKAQKIARCRMVAPPYVSYQQDYNAEQLKPLLDHWKTIRDEALQIPQWTAWPERQHYSKATNNRDDNDDDSGNGYDNPSWTVFPLCHCFPANQPENKKWIEQTCAFVPQTVQLLQQHLGPLLRTALFSRLDPETTLEAHTGWSDLANHVMRCHLPLTVPDGDVCGTWVDGCVDTHQAGQFLCFDDSKTHRAFNYSREERIVLILDLARPEHLPLGTATGGHTDELDQFIASMNL